MKNEEEPENHEPGPKKLGFKTALAHLVIKTSRPGDVDDGNIDDDIYIMMKCVSVCL